MALMNPDRPIKAILFDADGVIQTTHPPFLEKLAAMLPDGDSSVEEFVGEVAALERSALTGAGDFAVSLGELLQLHHSPMNTNDALNLLNLVKVDHGVLSAIAEVRRRGVLCCLATNQQRHRAKYMSETLGYHRLFDAEFYSCHLGVAKPDGAYFERILDNIGLDPNQVLFLDDHQANVDAAQLVGLHASVFVITPGADNRTALCGLLSHYGIWVGGTPLS
jgi:putative hydrolase of the HAD superfamily